MTDETALPLESQRVAELERRLADMEASMNSRVLQAELKAHAIKAGIVDLDGLHFVKTTDLKFGENGEIEGVAKVMADLKRAKPYLFPQSSSSSPAVAPPASQLTAKRATDMTHAEWQAARTLMLKKR